MSNNDDIKLKSCFVLVTHKNKVFEQKIMNLVKENFEGICVKSFDEVNSKEDIVSKVDIFIIDLLDEYLLDQLHNLTSKSEMQLVPWIVLIPDISNSAQEKLRIVKKYPDSFYLFEDEKNIDSDLFIHRLKCILKVPNYKLETKAEKKKLQNSIWKILNLSNLFVVSVDRNFKINLINDCLIKALGYDSDKDLLGQNWSKLLTPETMEITKFMHQDLLSGSPKYKEMMFDLIKKDSTKISAKWFNTLINSEFQFIFSVGIPLYIEPTSLTQNIDNVREYFRQILEKDRMTISAMKDIAKNRSSQLFGIEACSINGENKSRRITDRLFL